MKANVVSSASSSKEVNLSIAEADIGILYIIQHELLKARRREPALQASCQDAPGIHVVKSVQPRYSSADGYGVRWRPVVRIRLHGTICR